MLSARRCNVPKKDYWNGNDAAHRRIMYKGAGYSDEDIRNKLHIGVANTFTDASPATAHLRMLAGALHGQLSLRQ
jgi:dihydroxyacid dehydratase/phosphogluconate dehydratase